MLKQTLIVIGGTALLCAAALATSFEQPGPLPFAAMDLDGDGVVTAAEHATVREQRREARMAQGYPMRNAYRAPAFSAIDSNADGALDPAELDAWRQARRQDCGPMRGRGWRY
jgi:hypothetical protein